MKIIALEEEFMVDSTKEMFTSSYQEHRYTFEASSQILGKNIIDAMLDLGDDHLAAMDEAGIDLQVLSAMVMQIPDIKTLINIAIEGNNQAAETIKKHPTRYSAFANLPFAEPKAAIKEFERCLKMGFVGTMIYGSINGEFLDNKKYWSILEFAEAHDKPIYIHPFFPLSGFADAYFKGRTELLGPEWGFMVDASSHFMRMLTGGVFDQFPKLKIILGHLGESIPYNMERIDNRLSAYTKEKLKKSAAEYIKENLYVTTSGNFSTPSLLCAVATLGIDHVLFSVDWPNEANKTAVNFLKNLPVSEADLEKIAYKNATRILNLKNF